MSLLEPECLPTQSTYSSTSPQYAFPPFKMPTSKHSIRERDIQLRKQIARELTLATLKHPQSWDESWRSLLLVAVLLKEYASIEQLQDHPYLYERWWIHDSNRLNMKLLFTNYDGSSMVLVGTSVWDAEDSLSVRWVSLRPFYALLPNCLRVKCRYNYSGFLRTA